MKNPREIFETRPVKFESAYNILSILYFILCLERNKHREREARNANCITQQQIGDGPGIMKRGWSDRVKYFERRKLSDAFDPRTFILGIEEI